MRRRPADDTDEGAQNCSIDCLDTAFFADEDGKMNLSLGQIAEICFCAAIYAGGGYNAAALSAAPRYASKRRTMLEARLIPI